MTLKPHRQLPRRLFCQTDVTSRILKFVNKYWTFFFYTTDMNAKLLPFEARKQIGAARSANADTVESVLLLNTTCLLYVTFSFSVH